MSLEVGGVALEEDVDGAYDQDVAAAMTTALTEVSGGHPVRMKAVTPLHAAALTVEFSVLRTVRCDGADCHAVLFAVAPLASDVVQRMSTSISDGSLVVALVASAAALNMTDVFDDVTVDALSVYGYVYRVEYVSLAHNNNNDVTVFDAD